MMLKNLPKEIRDKVIQRRLEQSGDSANQNWETKVSLGTDLNGFSWADSPEGCDFWQRIHRGEFGVFYEKYQQTEKPIDPVQYNPEVIDEGRGILNSSAIFEAFTPTTEGEEQTWEGFGRPLVKQLIGFEDKYASDPADYNLKGAEVGGFGSGLRFNDGKPRYDLINAKAQKGLVDVLTFGSQKYDDHNWTKGMKWSSVLASMKRHIAAIERGEDYDPESGLLHIDHVQCNAHFLSAYYKIYPQGDDRLKWKLPVPKIALDIDEVICNWVGSWTGTDAKAPHCWHFDPELFAKFDSMREAGTLDEFYMGLSPLINPEDLPFEPHAYITRRPVDTEVTEKWLQKHGFPVAPVFTVKDKESKADIMLKIGADILVDDNYDTFMDCAAKGVCCFLMDAPHNKRYDVGYRRLYSLKDLM